LYLRSRDYLGLATRSVAKPNPKTETALIKPYERLSISRNQIL
jgi:hypothetical protein